MITNNEEYNNLYDKYKTMSREQLEDIINSEDQYRDIAKQVAKDILNNTKTEPNNSETYSNKENTTTYDVAKDIHFIKNAMLFFIILTIIGLILGIIAVIYFEKSYFDLIKQFSDYMGDLSM